MIQSGVLQTKLSIGRPNDTYEQEADRVADQVMRMPDIQRTPACSSCGEREEEEPARTKSLADQITPLIQRQLVQRQVEQEEEKEEPVQTKALSEQITPLVQRQEELEKGEEESIQTKALSEQITPLVQRQEEEPEEEEEEIQTKRAGGQTPYGGRGTEAQIHSIRGGGHPLPASARTFFEPRLGYDFSQVRVHTDTQAAGSAKAINSRAFTMGHDIVFGAGQYAPETDQGQRLLAHELTHVVQQDRSFNRNNTVRKSTNGVMTKPMLANKVMKSSLVIRRWGYGTGTGPLPHYVEVPPGERSRVNAARRIVERVVNNPRDYPRCHRAFQN
jgi:hypothetical protein